VGSAGTAALASRSARDLFDQAGPHLLEGQAAHQAVQEVVDAVQVARRDGRIGRDQLVLDLAAGGGDHRQQLTVAHLDELQVLDHIAVRTRGLNHDRQMAELAQHPGGPLHHLGHVAGGRRHPFPDVVLLAGGQAADAQEHVDVVPQAPFGRQAAAGGVGVPQEADLFQLAHDRANGGRRNVQPVAPRDRLRTDCLAGCEIFGHDGVQDFLGPCANIHALDLPQ
jgi:hypothetical protein